MDTVPIAILKRKTEIRMDMTIFSGQTNMYGFAVN